MAKQDLNRAKKKMQKAISLPNLNDARKRSGIEVENKKFEDANLKIGEGKTYHVRTYGCQGNVRDGETISGILESMGYKYNESAEDADVLLLNTCAIREGAEDKVWGYVGKIATVKKTNPSMIFGICGCMPQEETTVLNILSKYHHVDLVFGTHSIDSLPKLINDAANEKDTVINVVSNKAEIIENMPSKRNSEIKAFVNIMQGCDNFCTYCIVPYTRGKERSRDIKEIVAECNNLVNRGYKEITLLGQNVNNYGFDLEGINFADLLEQVAKTNIARIRFTTSNPWNFKDETIDTIAKYDNIMPFVHLPVQSGSNKILKSMNRGNTRESYIELFNKIKSKVKDVAITTDIIVGFPNETEEDFNDTYSLCEELRYDDAFSFVFSAREGTPAAKMKDDTNKDVYLNRLYKLQKLLKAQSMEVNQIWVGKEVDVLVEGKSKKDDTVWSGYTPQQKLVNFKADNIKVGDIVKVKIIKAKSHTLDGECK